MTMTGRPGHGGELAPVLRDAAAQSRELEAALSAERAALERQDIAALDEAGERKRDSLARLERLEQRRRQLLELSGYPADDSGMESLLADGDPDGTLVRLWIELREIAVRCRDANVTNGAIVQLRRRQIARALDVLRGAAEGTAPVYGADGRSGASTGRVVGSA